MSLATKLDRDAGKLAESYRKTNPAESLTDRLESARFACRGYVLTTEEVCQVLAVLDHNRAIRAELEKEKEQVVEAWDTERDRLEDEVTELRTKLQEALAALRTKLQEALAR